MSDPGPALRRGAELFDAGRYLEAHEVWEQEWRRHERGSVSSNLLQGLAQCAAAAVQLQRGKLGGARSLAIKGATLVEAAANDPRGCMQGLDLVPFARCMRMQLEDSTMALASLPNLLPKDGREHGIHPH